MFEGKELEGPIGKDGKYSVDVKPDLTVDAEAGGQWKLSNYLDFKASAVLKFDPLMAAKDALKDTKATFITKTLDALIEFVRPSQVEAEDQGAPKA